MMDKWIHTFIVLTTLLLTGCANEFSKYDQAFGTSLNKNLNQQKINSPYSKNERGQATAQELAPSYDAFQQGKSVQSSSGEKLSTPMSSSNNLQ